MRTSPTFKLHYCLSRREEPFWQDNANAASIPIKLQNLLSTWRYRPPNRFDFLIELESFSVPSYQCVLYGMGFRTDLEAARAAYPMTEAAEQVFAQIKSLGEKAVTDLPSHRNLIEQVYRSGYSSAARNFLSVPVKA